VERQVFQLERNRVKTITITRHDDPPAEDPAMAGTFELFRESSKAVEFKIRAMPPGREAQGSHATDQPATVLGYVYADDVTPVEKVDFSKCEAPAPPKPDAPAEKATPFSRTTSRYVTFDGVIVIVRVTKQDGKYYAAFAASFDEKERVEAPPAPKEGEAKPAEPSVPSADQVTLKAIDDAKKESLELAGKHEKWAYVIPEYSAKQLASRLSDMLKPPAQPTTVGPELQGPPVPGGPGENLLLPPK
jgi:hypothetical protein